MPLAADTDRFVFYDYRNNVAILERQLMHYRRNGIFEHPHPAAGLTLWIEGAAQSPAVSGTVANPLNGVDTQWFQRWADRKGTEKSLLAPTKSRSRYRGAFPHRACNAPFTQSAIRFQLPTSAGIRWTLRAELL